MREATPNRSGGSRKIPVTVVGPSHRRSSPRYIASRLKPLLQRWSQLPRKARYRLVILGTVLVIGTVGIFVLRPASINQTLFTTGSGVSTGNDSQATGPEYSTVTPSGAPIEQYGGWTRVSPANTDPAFAYLDKIEGTEIRVTQQPLPDDFKEDTVVQVEQLAQGYKANEKISVGNTTVYIGTSAQGPQSVIFSLDNLLILIKSSAKLSNDQWAQYVNSLQ